MVKRATLLGSGSVTAVVESPQQGIGGFGSAAYADAADFATAAQGALADSALQGSTGTWTPADASGAGLSLTVAGRYTKLGRMMFAYATITFPVTASGSNVQLSGLPVACANQTAARQGFVTYNEHSAWLSVAPDANATTFKFFTLGGNIPTNADLSGKTFFVMLIYET